MSHTVIRDVLLFDGESVTKDATVVFDGDSGLITSVSKSADASKYPEGARVIDGRGQTLLPGLIEAHSYDGKEATPSYNNTKSDVVAVHCHDMHLPEGGDHSVVLKYPLKAGVTTICDMHSDTESVHKLQKNAKEELEKARKSGMAGRVTMSDLKSSHLGATIEGGWPKPVVLGHDPRDEVIARVMKWPNLTEATAPDFIAQHKADGADYIKLMQENCCSLAMPTDSVPTATLELQTAVVKAAHAAGLQCYGHALSVDMTEVILKSGADGLTHTFIDQTPPQSIIDLYKETGAFVIPTLVILASLTNEEGALREKFADIAFKKGITDEWTKQNKLEVLGFKGETAKLEHAIQSVIQLRKAGIDVVAGTDAAAGLKGTIIGASLWMELEMYIEKCGFSVIDALKSATSVSARRFKFNDRGEVKEGKRADLVLVNGDVTQKLSNIWEGDGIAGVWKQGIAAA